MQALQETIARLSDANTHYNWCHMGTCNCGHLAQSLTSYTPAQIHAYALQKSGDWDEHAAQHCATSQYPIDWIMADMLQAGLTLTDIQGLERLSDRQVLQYVTADHCDHLDYRRREDLITYLRAFLHRLEDQWAAQAKLELPESTPDLKEAELVFA
jgi:hypothetical protein